MLYLDTSSASSNVCVTSCRWEPKDIRFCLHKKCKKKIYELTNTYVYVIML